MATQAKIIGVHPINADKPVRLIDLLVKRNAVGFDIGGGYSRIGRVADVELASTIRRTSA